MSDMLDLTNRVKQLESELAATKRELAEVKAQTQKDIQKIVNHLNAVAKSQAPLRG